MTSKPTDKRPVVTMEMIRADMAASGDQSARSDSNCSGNCATCPCSAAESDVNRFLSSALGVHTPPPKK